jgi:hypothetical protein
MYCTNVRLGDIRGTLKAEKSKEALKTDSMSSGVFLMLPRPSADYGFIA